MMSIEFTTVSNLEDLKKVAEEMKQSAPVTGRPQYSANEQEAIQRARQPEIIKQVESQAKSGGIRCITLLGVPVTMQITIDSYDVQMKWHLSMSIPGAKGIPQEVPAHVSSLLAMVFFGDSWIEGERSTGLKNVKHFFSTYQPPQPQ